MSKRRQMPSNNDLNEKEYAETASHIEDAFEQLDSLSVSTPDEHWFENMVMKEQERIRKKYWTELGWFIFSALFIVSGVLFAMMEMPVFFLVLQGAAIIFTGMYSYRGGKKQVESP